MDLLLPGILMWMVVVATANGKLISCICTTTHCQEQQTSRCNTTSMCFSQYLDRRDGSNPVIRGCITSKTPLLCENRRPAVALGNWPVLVCCNTNMCNQDVMPTPPVLDGRGPTGNTGESGLSPISTTADIGMGDRGGEGGTHDDATSDIPRASNFFNSIYIIVLVIGVCCLVVIGVIAVMVLRRQSHLYDDEFGDVERHGYLKGHHPVPRQDPDPQVNLPKVHNGTYDNKAVFNT